MANLSNINDKFVVEQTTGFVGIGTTDPSFLIEAAGTNAELALNASSTYRLRSTSSDEFIITKHNVGDKLTIASGGNATFAAKVFSTSTVSGDIGTTLVTKDYVDSGDGSSINTILVTAVAVAGQGNRYFLDGVQQANAVLQPGFTYRFDQSATTPSPGNGPHPLRFSITPDGTHNSGVEYTTGVTVVGTPGSAGAYTQIITTQATPVTLYYYCIYHSGMGGAATIRIIKTDGNATFAGNILIGNTVTNPASGFADQTGIGLKNSTTVPEIQVSSDSAAMQLGRTSTGGEGQILGLRKAGNIIHNFDTNNVSIGTNATFAGNITAVGTLDTDNITVGKGDGNNSSISLTANTGNWTFTNVQASRNLEISDSDGTGTVMTIDTSGNVGIGVTADTSVRTFIKGSDSGTNNFQILTRNSSDANILAVRNDGNVGIGTSSPDAKLEVEGTIPVIQIKGTGVGVMGLKTLDGAGLVGGLTYDSSTGEQRIVGAASYVFQTMYTGGSERMRIDSSGNVGIGATPNSYNNYTTLTLGNTSGLGSIFDLEYQTTRTLSLYADTNGGNINVVQAKPLIFYTSAAERMRIDSTGRTIIQSGTLTTPAYTPAQGYPLHVQGITNQCLIAIGKAGQTTGSQGMIVGLDTTTSYLWNRDNLGITFGTNDTTKMVILAAGNVGIGTTSPASKLHTGTTVAGSFLPYLNGTAISFATSTNIITVHDSSALGTNTAAGLMLVNNNNSNDAPSPLIAFSARSTSNTYNHTYAAIWGEKDSTGADTNWNTGSLVFATSTSTGPYERMRINPVGTILFGSTSLANVLAGDGAAFAPETNDRMTLFQGTTSTATMTMQAFYNPNGQVGAIKTSGSSTSFNTSSDYRLKENVVKMIGALDRVSQLKPSRFNFISDADKTVDGFLAHEVQEIVPEAITGKKDAVDKDGNPDYQGIDQSKLVPLLVGAIQELKVEIEILKNK